MTKRRWTVRREKIDASAVAQGLGVSVLTAKAMLHRGIHSPREAEIYLHGTLDDLSDARQIRDMEKGVRILAQAIQEKKKILIYGDYDVDGVSSITILYRAIAHFTNQVICRSPHRQKDGYGLQMPAVEQIRQEGTEVVLSCDNGIASLDEADRLAQYGVTFVVLDHHEPPQRGEGEEKQVVLPAAQAVIDPKRPDCPSTYKWMCAGGLSYRFAALLFAEMGQKDVFDRQFGPQALAFAAIATVCDIVDLTGDNRILVREGLKALRHTQNKGLRALLRATGREGKPLTETTLGFVIGPCINAAGRLDSAETAVRLFLTEDEQEAQCLAEELVALNTCRKSMTEEAVEQLIEEAEQSGLVQDRVMVFYAPQIHESVAGIVAGRLKEKYWRPVLVLTASSDGGAKGSGRSIPGYDMYLALVAVQDLLTRFGGHSMAAGLSLPVEAIDTLRRRLNENCRLTEQELCPVLRLDAVAALGEVTLDAARQLRALAPFGKENPKPLFGSCQVYVERLWRVGQNQDSLRLALRDVHTGVARQGMYFRQAAEVEALLTDQRGPEGAAAVFAGREGFFCDLAYTIEENEYQGTSSVQLILEDMRISRGE
ncbi:MAG TPA: single-stranded-DNA-specific exonuclease RecJ [Firmicutes bacterium]|nr:single-stranded-DNA-specific exonuclease RecJ [Bacillota bacterium]